MAAFVNPFGSSNSGNTGQNQLSSSAGKFVNPFAGYNPPQQAPQPQAAPVKQIPSNFGLGDIIPKDILSGVSSFLGNAEKGAEQAVGNTESFLSNLGKSLNPLRLGIANANPVTKAVGDIFNSLGTGPLKGKQTGNVSGPETFTGDTPTDVANKILDILPALLPGDGAAISEFSKTRAAISAATQAAVQIIAGAHPADIIQSLPFGFLGGAKMGEEPTSFSPAEIKGEVLNTDLAKTPLGNELMKSALDAKPDDTIQISHDPTSNLKTETGFPVKVEVHPQPTSEINTPEREAMRQQITNDLYGEGAKVKEKRIDIVMGGPGSGKSTTLVDPLAQEHGSIVVDADKVKPKIPESNGGKDSAVVHQESSDIAEGRLLSKAMSNGDNIVLPLVGKNLGKMQTMIKGLNDAGYEVHLHHMSLPPEEAVVRAEARFKSSGRYTDPNYILNEVGLKPDQNFDILKTDKGVKSYEKYSNNVPAGQAPKLLERSGRSETGQYIENSQTAKNPTVTEGTEGNRINSGGESKNPVNENNSSSTPNSGVRQELSNTAKSKLSSDIEKRLNTEFKDIPGYEKMNMKDQASKAVDLLSSDPEKAKAVAMGEENAPQGLRSGAVFTAVREQAFQSGDVQTLHDLAKTNLAGEAGQALKSFDTFRPGDTVKAIHDIIQSRTKSIEQKTGKTLNAAVKDEVAKIDKEVKKTASKPKLAEFIKNIQC